MADIARSKIYLDPLVTELKPTPAFYIAEVDPQEYYARNPNQPYCRYVVEPKVAKFRKQVLGQSEAEPRRCSPVRIIDKELFPRHPLDTARATGGKAAIRPITTIR
jgi:hypothetical protein